jgi:hypothetical protein
MSYKRFSAVLLVYCVFLERAGKLLLHNHFFLSRIHLIKAIRCISIGCSISVVIGSCYAISLHCPWESTTILLQKICASSLHQMIF